MPRGLTRGIELYRNCYYGIIGVGHLPHREYIWMSCFIIQIIYYILNLSISCDQNSHQLQCSIIIMWLRLYYITSRILHCHWWEFWSPDTLVQIILSIISLLMKIINSNNNRSKPMFLKLLSDSVVYILVVYLLYIIRLNLLLLYQILY